MLLWCTRLLLSDRRALVQRFEHLAGKANLLERDASLGFGLDLGAQHVVEAARQGADLVVAFPIHEAA